MAEVIDIPYRRIRGTKEWRAEQERLHAAWEEIEGRMAELGIKPVVLEADSSEASAEAARQDVDGAVVATLVGMTQSAGATVRVAELVELARKMRLARLLEE